MDGFWILVLKIAFLAILWLFIIIVTAIISSDMGGRRTKKQGSSRRAKDSPRATDASHKPSSRKKSTSAQEPWILVILTGSRAGERLQLVPEVRIGRSPQCELILDDDYVSGMHATLNHRSDGAWTLTDLGSTNGTFVNGNPVTTPTVVTARDVMSIGDVEMRLEAE